MRQTPPDIVAAALAYIAFWLIAVLAILGAGRRWPAAGRFRGQVLAQWKPALVIAAVYLLGAAIGGQKLLNPYAIAIFCQALIGLAIAGSLAGFKPLPVVDSIRRREGILREVALLLAIAVAVVAPVLLIGSIGIDIGRQVFGEGNYTQQAADTLPMNPWQAFFALLSGAGIAEETPYRLVLVSLLWKVSRRKWLAIILGALAFGAYHLTPLNGMYRIFWQFPVSQFSASVLIGLVWGYLYTRRGYETVVLGHTFSDWLPMLLFIWA